MKRVVAAGFCIVLGAELLALVFPDRRFVLATSGVAVALVLLAFRWYLLRGTESEPATSEGHDPEESLRRWLSRTQTLISWSDSTRSDWDRHLRPMLARQFEMATGQRKAKDPAAFHATGRMLFGEELWRWVDPENVSRSGSTEPGPGRVGLDEILRRLEQV
jgi:hypothetical protein